MVVSSGINGTQFAVLIQNAPTIITNNTAAILTITMTLFAFAASLVPLTNNAVTNNTIIVAGKFIENPVPA